MSLVARTPLPAAASQTERRRGASCAAVVTCAPAEKRASPVTALFLAGALLFAPAAQAELNAADSALVTAAQLQDTLDESGASALFASAAEAGRGAAVAFGSAAASAAADAAPVVLDSLSSAAAVAAPVVANAAVEGAKLAGSLLFEGAKAAAPYVGAGLQMAGEAALKGATAAAPYVGSGLQQLGEVVQEGARAAAPVVLEGVNTVGGAVAEGARGAWNASMASGVKSAAGEWVPICCSTNSCLQGPAACGLPPVANAP